MKTLSNYIKESEQVNESLLLAGLAVAFVCQPLLNTAFFQQVGAGIGGLFNGIGKMFEARAESKSKKEEKKEERKDKKEERKEKKEERKAERSAAVCDMIRNVAGTVREQYSSELKKDESLSNQLDTVIACTVDKDGNDIDPEKMQDRLKELTNKTPEQWGEENKVKKLTDEQKEELSKKLHEKLKAKSDAELDKTNQEIKERARQSAEKLQAKIDKAEKEALDAADKNDEEEFKKKNAEYEKLKDAQKKQKEKQSAEKDEHGNIIRDEEITDEHGNKKKVKMHVGPRGGKFYYPDGAPKDQEHRVYVENCYMSLRSVLESIIK